MESEDIDACLKTSHVETRMEDREFSEVDLRLMLEVARRYREDLVGGRWVIETKHRGRAWEVIVEPDGEEQRDGEIVRFAEFYRDRTGAYPRELVFDSQLTTYDKLDWLRQKGIRFLTLRRRSRQMLARIYSLPPRLGGAFSFAA